MNPAIPAAITGWRRAATTINTFPPTHGEKRFPAVRVRGGRHGSAGLPGTPAGGFRRRRWARAAKGIRRYAMLPALMCWHPERPRPQWRNRAQSPPYLRELDLEGA